MASLKQTLTALVTGKALEGTGTAVDEAAKWKMELQGAERFLEKFHGSGKKTVDAYRGDYAGADSSSRLNLFYANVVTLKAMLFSQLPKCEADRRFLDPDDDVARVAAEMACRVVENDLYDPDDTFEEAAKEALSDRLIPGLGEVRIKYNVEEAEIEGALPDEEGVIPTEKTDEWTDFVYTHWKDVLWSPCRTRAEMRWKAYRSYMDRDAIEKRFGIEAAEAVAYTSKGPDFGDRDSRVTELREAKEAEVWEIWDKPSKEVIWLCKGYGKILDKKPDPLELPEFWPSESMLANTVSDKLIPKSDYAMTQDLYREIDELQTRITLLTRAAKVAGVYDQSAKAVSRIFTEALENTLVPVENWAIFADKGGLKGVIDWVPLADIVGAIETLNNQLQARIALLYQVTGMSDIMRGQATTTGVTATEQKIKAQYGSVRIKDKQEEFGLFVQNLLNKKVTIIRKFYSDEQIVKLSNILNTPDAPMVADALALLRSDDFNCRVIVRASTLAQVDMENLKAERTEYMQATAQFLGQSLPLMQFNPSMTPFLLKLLRFGLSAFGSANEIEGTVDQYVAEVEKQLAEAAAKPPQPSPDEIKLQGEMQLEQVRQQGAAQLAQLTAQAEAQTTQMQAQADVQAEQAKLQVQAQADALQLEATKASEAMKAQFAAQAEQDKHQHELAVEAMRLETQRMIADANNQTKILIAQMQAQQAAQDAERQEAQAEKDRAVASEQADKDREASATQAREKAEAEPAAPVTAPDAPTAADFARIEGKIEGLVAGIGKPRSVIRGPDGKVSGVE